MVFPQILPQVVYVIGNEKKVCVLFILPSNNNSTLPTLLPLITIYLHTRKYKRIITHP
jgi:hypothetical protein